MKTEPRHAEAESGQSPRRVPFISVKLSVMDRPRSFLLDELDAKTPPAPGDRVVVQTERGQALGQVTRSVPLVRDKRTPSDVSSHRLVRRATREDVSKRLAQERREQEALRVCTMKVRERGLPMKLARVEQLFDGAKLIFYFTADGRVDFRELVRELAGHFRTRIEMRQIGPRDEAKMLGGYGSCGRPLCCTTWLTTFEPVTIKMAKRQHLSLSPSKLSGQCGRLKCCLRYELPNGQGVTRGGCAHEGGGCGSCGTGHCGRGDCGTCGA